MRGSERARGRRQPGVSAPGDARRRTALTVLGISTAGFLVWLAGCSEPADLDQPRGERPAFDGGAALALVERQVAFGPRVPNTPAHADALAFLADFLRARAEAVSLEPFSHVIETPERFEPGPQEGDTLRLTNVFASFAPAAGRRILLAAHWDSRPVAERDPDPGRRREPIPGANDGASGVAVLLALAELFARHPLPVGVGVDLLLLDGEDYGHDPFSLQTLQRDMFLGAKEFVRAHPGYRPRWSILLDMVGDAEPGFPREGNSLEFAPDLVRRVWDTARDLGYGHLFTDEPVTSVTDDHVHLSRGGIPTIGIIDFDYDAWHTSADTPDKLSAETLDAVGEMMLELVYNRL
ncbi:MAG: M28 family peptidase [Gemmatimonadota bacterium]